MQPKQEVQVVPVFEHLDQIYQQMPKYANDPEESPIIFTYDRILNRYQGHYGHQPAYFIRAPASPLLFGDSHEYVRLMQVGVCSLQNIVVAVGVNKGPSIRIRNHQDVLYGERSFGVEANWKLNVEGDEYTNIIIRCLTKFAEQHQLATLPGLDLLIYSDFLEEEFMYFRESLAAAVYCSLQVLIKPKEPLQTAKLSKELLSLGCVEPPLKSCTHLLEGKYGKLSKMNSMNYVQPIAMQEDVQLVIAHSMTPLPKKLIRGKRFNLRGCQVLIGIEIMKESLGFANPIKSIGELQKVIGCSLQELRDSVKQIVPEGRLNAEAVEKLTDKTLIEILREVPFANNVIDENIQFFPRNRMLFFLEEAILAEGLTSEGIVEAMKKSSVAQSSFLDIGSEEIEGLLKVAKAYCLAYKIVGNGWGGNLIFACKKGEGEILRRQLENEFYASAQNRVLLSDDMEQYVKVLGQPASGLCVLDPTSQIWY